MLRKLIYTLTLSLLPLSFALAATPKGIIELDSKPAVDFTISDMDGNEYSLQQSRGKWVFLHFWASWCGPCRREMPEIQELKLLMQNQPLDIVLVNTAETEDTLFSFLSEVAPQLHSYMDRDGQLTEKYAPRGLPTTFLIDPQGKRRYLVLGGQPWTKDPYLAFLEQLIQKK